MPDRRGCRRGHRAQAARRRAERGHNRRSSRAGGGIEIAPDRFDLLRDLARGAARRALEGHVLEQVRDAVLVGPLVAAAGADPDAQRGGLQVRHGVGDHDKARWQTRDLNAHAAAPVLTARLRERMSFSTAAASAGTVVTRSAPMMQVGEPIGKRRPHAAGRLDRIGELRGMRGCEHDHRDRAVAHLFRSPQYQPRYADQRNDRSPAAWRAWWRRSPPRRRDRRRTPRGCRRGHAPRA